MSLHAYDEDEMEMYTILSDLCNDHISLQLLEIPSNSDHGGDFAEDSKADLYVEIVFYVVDPCLKKDYPMCQPCEG